jgi:hypothetical protein
MFAHSANNENILLSAAFLSVAQCGVVAVFTPNRKGKP